MDQPRVFISYARQDGEFAATDLRRRLEREAPDISLWQDRSRLEGGVGWWKQITDALDVVEFLVLVMTPAALASPVARREWRYARLRGVCVYPVKTGEIDFDSLPRWMGKAHFFDLAREWDTFIHHLKSPCQATRVPFMAPDLPPSYVERHAPLEQLLAQLLDRDREQPVAITTALRGAGGLGKTTLAAALCHDDNVISAFDDGILWVTLGQTPNLVDGVVKLLAALTGERTGFVDLEDASFHLAQRLEDKNCLIVVDDVWNIDHLQPFLRGGSGCTRLITTRNFEIAAAGTRVDVDEMTPGEAVRLLTARLDVAPAQLDAFRDLARRLGEWPLLLELANASLRQRIERGDTVAGALQYVSRKLEQQGVIAFDQRNATARSRALTRTLELSLDQLESGDRDRYQRLSIFPEDVQVPVAHAAALWGCSEFEAVELLQRLDDGSLLRLHLHNATFHLHDVLRAYALAHVADVRPLHEQLLASWGNEHALPDGYAWRWLAYHLTGAGWIDRLRALLVDFAWLSAKLNATDVTALLDDLKSVEADGDVKTMEGAVRLGAHVLVRDKRQLAGQLLGRIAADGSEALTRLRGAAAAWRGDMWLRPLEPTLAAPGDALLFTLTGHTQSVLSVAVTPDGQYGLSASNDRTVRLWDLSRGTEVRSLLGHRDWVRAVAVAAHGRFAASIGDDQTIRVWDLESAAELAAIDSQGDWLRTVAITADGRWAFAAGDGRRILAFDVRTGRALRTWEGHSGAINTILLTRDGSRLISASDDRTIGVWDVASGRLEVSWRGHTAKIVGIALSSDERYVASVARDDTLRCWTLRPAIESESRVLSTQVDAPRAVTFAEGDHSIAVGSDDSLLTVWDRVTGARRHGHQGHAEWINAVAATPDGQRVISASNDGTLKVWSISPPGAPRLRKGHAERVRAIVASSDGRIAVSTADDGRLRIWDVATREERDVWRGQSHWPVALSSDGARVLRAAGDATLAVIDMATRETLRVLKGHDDRIRAVALTPDGRVAIAAGDDRTIRAWSVASGETVAVIPTMRHWVRSLTVTPDGRYVVSASEDRTVKIWELAISAEVRTLWRHDARVNAVALTHDGLVLSGSDDRTVRVWRFDDGGAVRTLTGHDARVNAVATVPRDDTFVSMSDDCSVRVWRPSAGDAICTYTGESPMTCGVVTCDDTVIAGDQAGRLHFLRLERSPMRG